MNLCFWIFVSIIILTSLFLLSVFQEKAEELREHVIFPEGCLTATVTEALAQPQERIRSLGNKLTSKSNRLEISEEKIKETKNAIQELELTNAEIQKKYRETLKELKLELAKTESECQNLHDQIEKITSKRDRLKQELDEHLSLNTW